MNTAQWNNFSVDKVFTKLKLVIWLSFQKKLEKVEKAMHEKNRAHLKAAEAVKKKPVVRRQLLSVYLKPGKREPKFPPGKQLEIIYHRRNAKFI